MKTWAKYLQKNNKYSRIEKIKVRKTHVSWFRLAIDSLPHKDPKDQLEPCGRGNEAQQNQLRFEAAFFVGVERSVGSSSVRFDQNSRITMISGQSGLKNFYLNCFYLLFFKPCCWAFHRTAHYQFGPGPMHEDFQPNLSL